MGVKTVLKFVSHVFKTAMAQKEHGVEGVKKHQQRFVVKLQKLKMVEQLKFGVMELQCVLTHTSMTWCKVSTI